MHSLGRVNRFRSVERCRRVGTKTSLVLSHVLGMQDFLHEVLVDLHGVIGVTKHVLIVLETWVQRSELLRVWPLVSSVLV